MKTQICLVSQQAAANLLPALDPALKPERAVLVVTEKMRKSAQHLSSVLRENAIAVEDFPLSNEQDFRKTQEELTELAAKLDGHDVTLNVTGGTKLMSVAAQSVANMSGWRMFYVDADTDQALWLDNDPIPPLQLEQQLRLKHYLQSYGFGLTQKPERPTASRDQQQLTNTLVQQAASLETAISQLNALAQEAENRQQLHIALNDWQRDSRSLDVLLRHFEQAQALSLQGSVIRFANQAQRDFVKGGWLELHAMQSLNQVHGDLGIRDKAIGLEIVDQASNTKNELDIAFMARNRLFVIECKTARIDKPLGNQANPKPPKANDTLFKLSENCHRCGLGTRGMLVTYRKLGDPEKRLATALNIKVVESREIANLTTHLKQWVNPKH